MGGTRAIDAQGVAGALARARRRGRWGVTLGLAGMVAFVTLVNTVDSRAARLQDHGIRAPGEVVGVDRGRIAHSLEVAFDDRGEARRARIYVDDSGHPYDVGQGVTVLIDPDDREHVSVLGEANQSPLQSAPMILLLVGGGTATVLSIGALARARRQRRILERHQWERRRGRYGELADPAMIGPNRRSLLLMEHRGGSSDYVLSLAGMWLSKLEASGLEGATEFEVAGPPGHHCIVRVPSSRRVVSARPPATARTERRWRRVFDHA